MRYAADVIKGRARVLANQPARGPFYWPFVVKRGSLFLSLCNRNPMSPPPWTLTTLRWRFVVSPMTPVGADLIMASVV